MSSSALSPPGPHLGGRSGCQPGSTAQLGGLDARVDARMVGDGWLTDEGWLMVGWWLVNDGYWWLVTGEGWWLMTKVGWWLLVGGGWLGWWLMLVMLGGSSLDEAATCGSQAWWTRSTTWATTWITTTWWANMGLHVELPSVHSGYYNHLVNQINATAATQAKPPILGNLRSWGWCPL